jgi:polyisoprenoid-binding protein YceI
MNLYTRSAFLALVSCVALGGAHAQPLTRLPPTEEASRAPTEQPSGRYTLDPRHTSVVWRVRHLGAAPYAGRFDTISGTLDFNADALEQSSVAIDIDARSVSTGLPGDADRDFDRRIANQVFDAEAHPTISFRSTGLERVSDTEGRLTGTLTLAGVEQPLTLDVAFEGGRFSPLLGTQLMGFTASGLLSRAAFGAAFDNRLVDGAVGDAVELIISAEFHKERS